MTTKERWTELLNPKRLCGKPEMMNPDESRTPFDMDYGRVVFSSQFRRLQDKTQVFPLAKSDYTRTRLTHTMEVASVGQGLGKYLGKLLEAKKVLPEGFTPADVGTIVSVACLAHDLGNPPFGHSGEAAIQEWAENRKDKLLGEGLLTDEQYRDIAQFEGNAQSFRILARTWDRSRKGGAQLTYASYGALLKYPQHSGLVVKDPPDCAQKKFNYFHSDTELAESVRRGLGLEQLETGRFRRHPLVYVMEAADDICYHVVDAEDAYDAKLLTKKQLCDIFAPLLDKSCENLEKLDVSELRASAIRKFVQGVQKIISNHFDDLTAGLLMQDLLSMSMKEDKAIGEAVEQLKKLTAENVYGDHRILQIEAAGFKVLGGLLDELLEAMPLGVKKVDLLPKGSAKKVRQLFPEKYLVKDKDSVGSGDDMLVKLSAYERVLAMTDFVSGMTDSYALELHQTLTGVRIP